MVDSKTTTEVSRHTTVSGDALIQLAEERVRQGLDPPPDIYRIEYRRRVDWSHFPAWARPVDPEAFDGCCHEG